MQILAIVLAAEESTLAELTLISVILISLSHEIDWVIAWEWVVWLFKWTVNWTWTGSMLVGVGGFILWALSLVISVIE